MRSSGPSTAPDALSARLASALARRQRLGTLRVLPPASPSSSLDFCSNDYLGLARSAALRRTIHDRLSSSPTPNGATGSRLLSGNSRTALDLETSLAAFYRSAAALVFSSGYAANLGVLGCLPQRGDLVLYDADVHNSSREGLRLSRAADVPSNLVPFRHNALDDLERLLLQHQSPPSPDERPRLTFILVEGVYSMDGSAAPLRGIVELARRHDAYVIVDEAHSVGVLGPRGRGVCGAEDVGADAETRICCRVYTFGKALGVHGAAVCGPRVLVNYLINYARSFVFSTAPAPDQLMAIQCAHDACAVAEDERRRLQQLRRCWKRGVHASAVLRTQARLLPSASPIQALVLPGAHRVQRVAEAVAALGVAVLPIRAPTVPAHQERLRVVLHAFNTKGDVDRLIHALETAILRCQEEESIAARAKL